MVHLIQEWENKPKVMECANHKAGHKRMPVVLHTGNGCEGTGHRTWASSPPELIHPRRSMLLPLIHRATHIQTTDLYSVWQKQVFSVTASRLNLLLDWKWPFSVHEVGGSLIWGSHKSQNKTPVLYPVFHFTLKSAEIWHSVKDLESQPTNPSTS